RVGTAADPALDVEFDEEADGGPEAEEAPAAQPQEPETVPEPAKPAPPSVTVFGEVFSTYILCQIGEEFVLIDKHAAHERIRYNRLKAEGETLSRQLLLAPVTVNLSREDHQLALENREALLSLGFEA